jgi:hypothetical protein
MHRLQNYEFKIDDKNFVRDIDAWPLNEISIYTLVITSTANFTNLQYTIVYFPQAGGKQIFNRKNIFLALLYEKWLKLSHLTSFDV